MKQLKQAASLFEVNVPDFKQLKACRKEVGMLKALWDMVTLVKSSFGDWNSTLWSAINVEQMDMDCKKFVKDIRTLDKEMRAWNVFTGVVRYVIAEHAIERSDWLIQAKVYKYNTIITCIIIMGIIRCT